MVWTTISAKLFTASFIMFWSNVCRRLVGFVLLQ